MAHFQKSITLGIYPSSSHVAVPRAIDLAPTSSSHPSTGFVSALFNHFLPSQKRLHNAQIDFAKFRIAVQLQLPLFIFHSTFYFDLVETPTTLQKWACSILTIQMTTAPVFSRGTSGNRADDLHAILTEGIQDDETTAPHAPTTILSPTAQLQVSSKA